MEPIPQIPYVSVHSSFVRYRPLTGTGENADTTMWTAAETNTAIICSCLPAIRALYKTGRKVASESASKRKSLTILSFRGGKSKHSQSGITEEYPLEEELVKKEADRKITIIDLDKLGTIPEDPVRSTSIV